MRLSNHRGGGRSATVALVVVIVAACSGTVATPAPVNLPTPVPTETPDPHFVGRATADEVFIAIRDAGLGLRPNNATAGQPNGALVKRINAEIANWPLIISEYRDAAALRAGASWDAAAPLAPGDRPYAFVGLNILIEFGPARDGKAPVHDASRRPQVEQLVALIDSRLSPLEQRSLVPVDVEAAVSGSAIEAGRSARPSAAP